MHNVPRGIHHHTTTYLFTLHALKAAQAFPFVLVSNNFHVFVRFGPSVAARVATGCCMHRCSVTRRPTFAQPLARGTLLAVVLSLAAAVTSAMSWLVGVGVGVGVAFGRGSGGDSSGTDAGVGSVWVVRVCVTVATNTVVAATMTTSMAVVIRTASRRHGLHGRPFSAHSGSSGTP